MKPKIGIITLGVSDLKKSLVFYRDGLGFSTHDFKEEMGIVFFKLEGTWLALYPREKLAQDHSFIGKAGGGITPTPHSQGDLCISDFLIL